MYYDKNGNLTNDYYGYVYVTLDQKHNLVYIGQKKGKPEKSKNYFGSGKRINDIRKSRGTYFLKKTILGVCYTREELLECEYECKLFFNAFDKLYGYNYAKDDCGGDTWTYSTEESKKERIRKISEKAKGRPSKLKGKLFSDEQKQKMRKTRKPKPEGFREKISKAMKGRESKLKGKNNPSFIYVDIFKVFELRKQRKTFKEICNILNISWKCLSNRLNNPYNFFEKTKEIEGILLFLKQDDTISYSGKNHWNFSKINVKEILELKEGGMLLKDIAQKLGISYTIIYNRLKNPEKYL